MVRDDRSNIARRMEAMGQATGGNGDFVGEELRAPRWRLDYKWVEFECGCRAERFERLYAPPAPWEPVIFIGLPQQAVYDSVCDRHAPEMNKRIGMGAPGLTFYQWKRGRRAVLTGRVRP